MEIKFHSANANWFDKGTQNVRVFVYNDYSIETHDHDFYELNIVLRGKGTHAISGARIEVEAGSVFMIPPSTVHAYYDTDSLDVLHILIHKDFVEENRAEAEKVPGFLRFIEIEPFVRANASDEMFLRVNKSQLQEIREELSLIEDNGEYDREELLPLKIHTAWKIIYKLSYMLYQQTEKEQNITKNEYEYAIINCLEYIHKNYGEKITVSHLCCMTYLSRSTFLRSFYEICSCTPSEYINRYRCKKALQMIDKAECTKTEIAHRCGFYDLSHMERFLKKYS